MFVIRSLTALILIIAGVFLYDAPPFVFQMVTASFVLIAAWEWAGFLRCTTLFSRLAYVLCVLAAAFVFSYERQVFPVSFHDFLGAIALWWFAMTLVVARYPRGFLWTLPPVGNFIFWALFGALSLSAFKCAMDFLYQTRIGLLWCAIMVSLADTGAYLVGRTVGRTLFLPAVSPKKTWEGVLGGLLSLGLCWMIFAPWARPANWSVWAWLMAGVVFWFFAVLGDLLESALKRQVGLKDSGSILPGHGGMLDRFDSWFPSAVWLAWVLGA